MSRQPYPAMVLLFTLAATIVLPDLLPSAKAHGTGSWNAPASSASASGVIRTPEPPLLFVENVGQFADEVRFQVAGDTTTVHVTDQALWFTWLAASPVEERSSEANAAGPAPTPGPDPTSPASGQTPEGISFRFEFVGANPFARPEPYDRLDTRVSYLLGNATARWRPDVPAWRGVRYSELYPGVDLELAGDGGRWNWRFIARSAHDLAGVQMVIAGADRLSTDAAGRLVLTTTLGATVAPTLSLSVAAVAPAMLEGTPELIAHPIISGDRVTFVPTAQPPAQAATLSVANTSDLVYSTLIGGSGFDGAHAIVGGTGGVAYLVGETISAGFPTTPGVFSGTISGSRDIFVAKLHSFGTGLAYSTFIGGAGNDTGYALSVDPGGAVVVAGQSTSSNFPTTLGAYDRTFNGAVDTVVFRLDAAGTALGYSTFLGGSNVEQPGGIALDPGGAAYVGGYTASTTFPTTAGAYDTTWNGGSPYSEGFITKLTPGGESLAYSTLLGGSSEDVVNGIAVDSSGAAYLTGWTGSSNFPTTAGAFGTTFRGVHDLFITKIAPGGGQLGYSGLLGGSNDDQAQSIALDGSGAVYVTGQSNSNNFRVTPGALSTSLRGSWDGIVAKVDAAGGQLIYSTYLGGGGNDCETPGIDRECVLTVDAAGVAYIAGRTYSADFPTTPNGLTTVYGGTEDGFMVRLKPDGTGLVYGSYFGGSQSDQTLGVAVDSAGAAYVVGRTYSANFPASPGAFDSTYNGGGDAFVIKLRVGGYASGPRPDPARSTVSIQPASLPADGITAATISVELRAADGSPAWGKTVLLASSRGAVDSLSQPATVTGSDGRVTATLRASTAGDSTITAYVLDDGVLLAATAMVSFTPYTPPTSEFLFQLDQMVAKAISAATTLTSDATVIASQGDYFRGAIDRVQAERALNALFNAMAIVDGVKDWKALQQGIGVGLPGMRDADGPFFTVIDPSQNFRHARDLLRSDVWFLVRRGTKEGIAEELAYTGAKYFAAQLRNSVTKTVAKETLKQLFVVDEDGMSTVAAPAIRNLAHDITTTLELQRLYVRGLPLALPLAYQQAYEQDFQSRSRALTALAQHLADERMTLESFRQAHDQQPDLLANFLLRFVAKETATVVFDGPGAVAVGATLGAFDWYMDSEKLDESQQMFDLASGAMLGAPDGLRQIYSIAYGGLNRVVRRLPADTATGSIVSLNHFSQGGSWDRFWEEKVSWSEVTLTNTGRSTTTYRVLVDYLADTSRFGVPWGTMNKVDEVPLTLEAGQTGTLRIYYKRTDGTRGLSPREGNCLLVVIGCVGPSNIGIQVLGTNATGTFYVDSYSSPWEPTQVRTGALAAASLSGQQIAPQAGLGTNGGPAIDPPLTSYVLSSPWSQRHEAQLWVNNPFTSTIEVTITQPLPAGVALLDAGGAQQSGDTLIWTTTVSPTALRRVGFSFAFPAVPGTSTSLAGASMTLTSPLDGQPLTATSNAVSFAALWPVTLEHATPGYVAPGGSASASISITNWLSDRPVSGTMALSLTDALSATVYTASQQFSVAAGATDELIFALPANLPPGSYIIAGVVSAESASAVAFADTFQVGLPGPLVDYRVAPLGEVRAGDVLTYTAQFSNDLDLQLSGAVITASIPLGGTVVDGSISGGGSIVGDQVRWELGPVAPGGEVRRSFTFRVAPVVADAGSRELRSEARLTAAEIAESWGPVAWNPVSGIAPLALSAARLDFGRERIGATSGAQSVTLTNPGAAALELGSVATTGDFRHTHSCPASLAPGAQCTVSVTFAPLSAGLRAGALAIRSSAGIEPQVVELSGIGGDDGVQKTYLPALRR